LTLAFACVGLAFSSLGATTDADPWAGGRLAVGCNYWASHAGVYMWRNWNPAQVEKDFDLMAAQGMTVLRVFPLWPDFQPLTLEFGSEGKLRGYSQSNGSLANSAAVDDRMVERFRFLCAAAEKRGIRLIVGLVTGWMSGKLFVPTALERENLFTSPVALAWQSRYVRYLVNALKDCPAILAWDFGNECNNLAEGDSWAMWNWLHAIGSEVRLADPTRALVSGLFVDEFTPAAKNTPRQLEELADVMTTHPYPLWSKNCNLEKLDSIRNACHPAFETTLYANVCRRPAIVEEAGSLGPGVASDACAARTMRMQLFGAWAAGIPMYLWWCAFDQDRLAFPPYEWTAIEQELGLFTADGRPKATARELKAFAEFLRTLPFNRLPPRQIDATVVFSETEDSWTTMQGAWLLSRQAGFDVGYARAEDPLPESSFYILPSGVFCETYSRTAWRRVLEKAEKGATVLVTLGDKAILSGLEKVAGVEVESLFERSREIALDVDGREVRLSEPTTRLVTVRDAEVLLADRDGKAFLTSHPYGKGKVLLAQAALERNAQIDGWPIYRMAAHQAGVRRLVRSSDRSIGFSEHRLPAGGTIVVAVNYENKPAAVPVAIDGCLGRVLRGEVGGGELRVAPCDAAVFEVLPNSNEVK